MLVKGIEPLGWGLDCLLELEADYLMVSKVDGVKAQLRTLKEMGVLK